MPQGPATTRDVQLSLIFRALVLVAALAGTALQAQDRIALVMGNSVYGTITSLDNPANDARLMAESLEAQGFAVTLLIDSNQIEMKRGISQFGRDLRGAGTNATGLFFYAGHGVQSFGTNYLLPVDISLSDAADLDLVAIEAQSVLQQMYSARNRTNIVILDACRNNPFNNVPEFNDNGLAEMKAPTGTFLSYATGPGGVALDGLTGNSPFTQAVAAQMGNPGQLIEQMFKQVRVDVLEVTNGQQTPWDSSSLTSDFRFAEATKLSGAELEAQQLWASVKVSRDPVQIMLFLRGYPDSSLTDEARALLAEVMEQELAGETPAQPKPAPQGPSENETKMFEATQTNPSISGYQAYLQSYPNGIFAEFATQELAALKESSAAASPTRETGLAQPQTPTPEPEATESAAAETTDVVTFTQALVSGLPQVSGRSIAELIKSQPLYPPVEGLPDSYWKDQKCSNCHKWTVASICEQANTYLSLNRQRSLSKQHPFGGALKQNLRTWAAAGCPK